VRQEGGAKNKEGDLKKGKRCLKKKEKKEQPWTTTIIRAKREDYYPVGGSCGRNQAEKAGKRKDVPREEGERSFNRKEEITMESTGGGGWAAPSA